MPDLCKVEYYFRSVNMNSEVVILESDLSRIGAIAQQER